MNTEIEKKLWRKADKYCRILQMVPFVKMVAVCNNLAFGKVDENSDIDLFVVAERDKLFTVRAFITFLLEACNVRRHGDKVAGRFCLSFFVDEDHLSLKRIAIENDIYLAFWIKSMVPLIAEGDIVEGFLQENRWAREYFEYGKDLQIRTDKVLPASFFSRIKRRFFKFMLDGGLGILFEDKTREYQLKRAQKKVEALPDHSGTAVNKHMLKFHNTDRRVEYRDKWIKKYGRDEKLTETRFSQLFP